MRFSTLEIPEIYNPVRSMCVFVEQFNGNKIIFSVAVRILPLRSVEMEINLPAVTVRS